MPASQEAMDARPKRPQNAYFTFRGEKLAQLKDDPEKAQKVKELWDNIDPDLKKKLEDEYHEKNNQHKLDLEAWMKKYHLTEDDIKEYKKEKAEEKKSKKKGKDTDDEEERKPIKTKGTKETKQEKRKREEEEKIKEEEEARKREEEEKAKARNASKAGKSKNGEGKADKKKTK